MSIVLAADMHLHPGKNVEQNSKLSSFLAVCLEYGELVLIGDTFNCWYEKNGRYVGDYAEIIDIFAEAVGRGLNINLLCGNRDFVLSRGLPVADATVYPGFTLPTNAVTSVLAEAGIRLRGWVYNFKFEGVRYHCAHGDTYCIDNVWHQLLRYLIMGNPARLASCFIPVEVIHILFTLLKVYTRETGDNRSVIPDYLGMQDEALAPLIDSGVDHIICGHMHQYQTRQITGRSAVGNLTVLPCWVGGGYALLENKGIVIKNLTFS